TYMSPEQAAGEDVDTRSDIYSLGLVAYEMLAGAPPFEGSNRVVVSRHISERPVSVRKLRPETPVPLADAIMHALEKQPSSRWQTGEEFRKAILGETRVPRTRRWRRPVIAALGLAAVMGGIALGADGGGPPEGVDPRHSILVLPFNNVRNDPSVEWLRDGSVS